MTICEPGVYLCRTINVLISDICINMKHRKYFASMISNSDLIGWVIRIGPDRAYPLHFTRPQLVLLPVLLPVLLLLPVLCVYETGFEWRALFIMLTLMIDCWNITMKQHYVNVNYHKHGCIWYIYMLPIHLTLPQLYYIWGMELGRNPFLFCIWALSFEIIKFQPLILYIFVSL